MIPATRSDDDVTATTRAVTKARDLGIALGKANTLIEALPWLARFHGKTVVVKYGGHAMVDAEVQRAFAADLVFLRYVGIKPVVVHGGGPQISSMLSRLGIATEFRGGLRVTTPESIDVVRMVLVGQVGRELVGLVNEHGPFAVGMSGEDARLFTAKRRPAYVDGGPVDVGLVGEVDHVNIDAVADIIGAGRIPVISTVAPDARGVVHNLNADTAAGALAAALGADKLIVLTDVPGLYRDWPDTSSLVSVVSADRARADVAEAGGRDGAEDGSLPARRPRRGAGGTRGRRKGATLPPAGDLHGRGVRDNGDRVMSALTQRWSASMMDNYGTPWMGLVRGEGAVLWDEAGKSYVDLLGGIAVNVLGHAHPAVVAAVARQISTLGHVSNLFVAEPPVALAERLLAKAGRDGRVFFCNSGAEANEAAFKLSRRTGRTHVVAAAGGFHGRTMGALALTGQPAKADPFRPLPGDVEHVPYGDVGKLAAAVTDATAMVILEPIQGENGVVVPPAGYLASAREITASHGTLLVLDEVQTGVGRTGHWFAHQAEGIEPDVITLAKGLGGGLPIGACVVFGQFFELLEKGSHGSTFGGNPVVCAAALAVLDTIEKENLLDHAKRLGERLRGGIEALGHPLVAEVRGAGFLLGIALTAPVAARVSDALRTLGFLTNAVQPDAVRLAPPLVLTADQADAFLAALPGALTEAGRGGQE